MASGGGNGDGDKNQLKLYSYWRSSCSRRVRIALNLKGLKYENIAVNLVKGEHFSPEFLKLNPLGYVPVLVDGDIVLSDSFAIILYLEEKYPQHPLLPRDLQKRGINYQAASIVSSSIQPLQNLAILKYIEEKVGPNEQISWAEQHIEKGFAALEKLLKDYAGRYATGDEVFMDVVNQPEVALSFTLKDFPLVARNVITTSSIETNCYLSGSRTQNKMSELTPQSLRLQSEDGCSPKLWIPRHEGTKLNSKADLFLAPQLDAATKRFNVNMTQFPLLSRLHEAYNEIPAFQDAMPQKQPDASPASTC